jgi:hypothetical protein
MYVSNKKDSNIYNNYIILILNLQYLTNNEFLFGCWWLTPVILAIQEAEIRKITVRSQTREIVGKTLS